MENNDTEQPAGSKGGINIPETIQEETRNIISGAFQLFENHNQRLAEDLAEFNEKRKKVRENIAHGARRTTGRII